MACILLANSCNLNKAKKKAGFVSTDKKSKDAKAVYKRFIRLFKHPKKSLLESGLRCLLWQSLSNLELGATIYLSLDRTKWKLGCVHINPLVLGVVLPCRKFIPLWWVCLDKGGNSNQAERMALLQTFLEEVSGFEGKRIVLTADREFIGKKWFAYLAGAGVDFVIRIRYDDYRAAIAAGFGITCSELTAYISRQIEKRKSVKCAIELDGQPYYFHAKRNTKKSEKEPFIYWVSTLEETHQVVIAYDKRWQIEPFFRDSKRNGLDLEAMNFTDLTKVSLMLAICSWCYVKALKEGIIVRKKKGKTKVIFDKKANRLYPRVSLFTLGYQIIEQYFYTILKMGLLESG